MNKYRGTRGVRDYAREARELVPAALVLAGMCAGVIALSIFLFASNFFARRETVPAIVVFAEIGAGEFLSHEAADSVPSIVPLSWGDGIFFDAHYRKLLFPHELDPALHYTYCRTRHTVTFSGANFPLRLSSVLRYEILPTHIFREGEGITFFNYRGVFAERGETQTHSYIRIIDPRERYHTIVVIDAGHGGRDPGAPSFHRGGMWEAEIVLTISQKILEIFNEPGVLLVPTRTCDYFVSTASRARIANAIGDYFISIHNNADARSSRSRGTLTLYGTAANSLELAQKFQTALISALGGQDRGIHYAPQFHILRESEIPVVLLEILFQSNPYDATRLANPATQMLIAQTLADTIKNLPPAR
jgi:N-acetylmuramoyl-L-alanine amidase